MTGSSSTDGARNNVNDKNGAMMTHWNGGIILLCFVVVPPMFCAAIFPIYLLMHAKRSEYVNGVREIPTISRAGTYYPESTILTLGLHIEAFLLVLVLNMVFHLYKRKCEVADAASRAYFDDIHNEQQSFVKCWNKFLFSDNPAAVQLWNIGAYWMGIIAALFMFLTGTVPTSYYPGVHEAFAYLGFIFSAFTMLTYHFKVCRPFIARNLFQQRCLRLQNVALIILVPFSIAMLILENIVSSVCTTKSCYEFSLNVETMLEYTTTIALLVFMEGFRDDLARMSTVTVFSTNRTLYEHLQSSGVVYGGGGEGGESAQNTARLSSIA